mmetsp:Transcript_16254/g.41182  ORF Transcript_16254/g.41182 Transcript_16254/m.41182 type:complete len:136 (-) Transcript_16254:544-951(-)
MKLLLAGIYFSILLAHCVSLQCYTGSERWEGFSLAEIISRIPTECSPDVTECARVGSFYSFGNVNYTLACGAPLTKYVTCADLIPIPYLAGSSSQCCSTDLCNAEASRGSRSMMTPFLPVRLFALAVGVCVLALL